MATPKKRTGKASQATRRANWKGSIPATTICPNCKSVVLTHTVCPACGWYKDGFASNKKTTEEKVEKQAAPAPEVKEEEKKEVKKTRKPRAKKADSEAKKEEKAETKKEEKAEESEAQE